MHLNRCNPLKTGGINYGKVESRGENNALLKKFKKKNHGLVALLTVWWTCGIGNLIYAFIPAKVEDEVMVKLEIPPTN